jgi:hypothetical protein
MIAVLLHSSHGQYAYPFEDEDRAIAERFAAFLDKEVDPAEVVPGSRIGPNAVVTWQSPLTELLNHYERFRGDAR